MIYVPYDPDYDSCYVVQNENVIRGYDRYPTNNTSYNYRDYYIHSDYMFKDGSGSWSQYSTLPVCLDSSVITNDFYYRNDFWSICIIFMTLFFFVFFIPFKLFSRFFRRLK